MNQETNLAEMAVKITEVIKSTLKMDGPNTLVVILDRIPELSEDANKTISLFIDLAEKLGIRFNDVYDILDQIKLNIRTAVSEVSRGSLLHTIATVLYTVSTIALNFLPPAWKDASKAVIIGYEALYGGEGK